MKTVYVNVAAENSAYTISHYRNQGYRLVSSEYYGGTWFLTFAR